jgi:hypothetical protein
MVDIDLEIFIFSPENWLPAKKHAIKNAKKTELKYFVPMQRSSQSDDGNN